MSVKPGIYSLEEARKLGLIEDLPAAIYETQTIQHTQPDSTAGDDAMPGTQPNERTRRPRRTTSGTYDELRMLAETYYDVSKFAVGIGNREGAAIRDGVLDLEVISGVDSPSVLFLEAKKRAEYMLTECYRMTAPDSVIKWQEDSVGVGALLLARLLGITGHPRHAYPVKVTWETLEDGTKKETRETGEPYERSVSQLWQYCGHGAPKRFVNDLPDGDKGKQAVLMSNGNPSAKMIVHLLAECQVKSNAKNGTAYRWLYDQVKQDYADANHNTDCARCKRKAGEPLRQAHVHANALRIVGKELLRDLWIAAGK